MQLVDPLGFKKGIYHILDRESGKGNLVIEGNLVIYHQLSGFERESIIFSCFVILQFSHFRHFLILFLTYISNLDAYLLINCRMQLDDPLGFKGNLSLLDIFSHFGPDTRQLPFFWGGLFWGPFVFHKPGKKELIFLPVS